DPSDLRRLDVPGVSTRLGGLACYPGLFVLRRLHPRRPVLSVDRPGCSCPAAASGTRYLLGSQANPDGRSQLFSPVVIAGKTMSEQPKSEFERSASDEPSYGLLSDVWFFLRHNKKWWLGPIL